VIISNAKKRGALAGRLRKRDFEMPGLAAVQPHTGLVDKAVMLERMAGSFIGHLWRGQPTEFLANDGEHFDGTFWINVFHPFQNVRELIHVSRIERCLSATTSNYPIVVDNARQPCKLVEVSSFTRGSSAAYEITTT